MSQKTCVCDFHKAIDILGDNYAPDLPITQDEIGFADGSKVLLQSDEVYRGVETFSEAKDINDIAKVWDRYKQVRLDWVFLKKKKENI